MARARLNNGTPVHISLDADLVAWLDDESRTRMVSRSYLITRGLELLREQIPTTEAAS